ncbi:FKBP-type peptidyl-prolyl cis-trans isomerase [Flavicella sp.]|uniref:FKBP-type peptidyl-prolyl cis-trans isomerase n=1 Tax=Flavicella sp. TaxID=2957742 RepID=UPI00301B24B0
MKIKSIAVLGLVATIAFTSCNNQKRQASLATEIDSVSYALGLDMANKIKTNFPNSNGAAFIEGYENAADTSNVKIEIKEIDNLLRVFFMKKQQEDVIKAADSSGVVEEIVNSNTTAKLLSEHDSVSYALGLDMALKLKPSFEDINNSLFVQGYKELGNEKVLLELEGLEDVLRIFFMARQQKQAEEQINKDFGQIKEDGLKFLEENKAKEGVVVTESGLQYIVIKEGNGIHPEATDNVTVHYHGTIPDGTVFDSSVDRGAPSSFGLNQVIKGWTEGLQLMGEGAKFTFYIPQELAYGANPRGGLIKPFMPLVFEVELIKVNK